MRRITLMLSILIVSTALYAANVNPITTAFKCGDASALNNNIDKEVVITLPSVTQQCLGSEAIKILNGFFSSNKPNGFIVIHQAEKTTTGFYIGRYTSGANNFRINITYKISGDSILIQSIRIE